MKHPRSRQSRAALVAATLIVSPSAWARDTAGPDRERPAEPKPGNAAAPAAQAARAVAGDAATATAPAPSAPRAPSAATAMPPAPARAASEAADADAERAKQLYALGAEAFAAQRNADAIRYFRRAAEIVPSAKLTYNIGLAYEEMGDAGRALAEYRSYLEQDATNDPVRRDEVRGRIARLEQRLAETGVQQLLVVSDPPGATVRVAGRALGLTPWTGELPPGEHVVELELPGHAPESARVTLAPDHAARLALTLAPLPPAAGELSPSAWANVSPLTWTFLGVGAASLAGGLAFELSRSSSSDTARRADDPTDAAEARGAADAKQMASLVLFGFGAGFTIGGSVLLAVQLSEEPSSDQVALGLPCGPGFCGFVTRGRF